MPILATHIYSNFGRRLYGAAGTEVKIVSDHGNVQIVEDANGNRFPVKTELLTSEPVPVMPVVPAPAPTSIPGRSFRKKTIRTQPNLF